MATKDIEPDHNKFYLELFANFNDFSEGNEPLTILAILEVLKNGYLEHRKVWREKTGADVKLEDIQRCIETDGDTERKYMMSFYLHCLHHTE